MRTHDIQAEKLNLIAWISQLKDTSVIEKLKSIQADNIEIPVWQKKIVRERIKKTKPEDYLSWEDVEDQLLFKK